MILGLLVFFQELGICQTPHQTQSTAEAPATKTEEPAPPKMDIRIFDTVATWDEKNKKFLLHAYGNDYPGYACSGKIKNEIKEIIVKPSDRLTKLYKETEVLFKEAIETLREAEKKNASPFSGTKKKFPFFVRYHWQVDQFLDLNKFAENATTELQALYLDISFEFGPDGEVQKRPFFILAAKQRPYPTLSLYGPQEKRELFPHPKGPEADRVENPKFNLADCTISSKEVEDIIENELQRIRTELSKIKNPDPNQKADPNKNPKNRRYPF